MPSLLWLLLQGANQAAAAAKLGYPTMFCGQVAFPTSAPERLLSLHVLKLLIDVLSHSPYILIVAIILYSCLCMASCMGFTARKLISAACMQTGTDQFSDQLAQQLLASGCQLDLLKQVEGPTGTAVIMLQPNGMHLSPPVLVFCRHWIKYCAWLLHRAVVAELCTLA